MNDMTDPARQDELTALISADLGITSFSVEEQRTLIAQFGIVAMKAATVAVTEKLSPEAREEFVTLAEAGDPAALQAFLDREVPGHEEIAKTAVAEEVRRFKSP